MKELVYNTIGEFTTTKKIHLIVVIFLFISFSMTGLLYLQGNIADGVRGFVKGEGLWAKAQKDAVLYLERYALTHKEKDYQLFNKALDINYGDKIARLAMLKERVNKKIAKKGLLQGGNDPEDIDSMIWFFLTFKDISYLKDATDVWTKADGKIEELFRLGELLYRQIDSKTTTKDEILASYQQLEKLNSELLILENRFSNILSEGSRWVKSTIWWVSISILILFLGIATYFGRQILHNIVYYENALLESESRFRSLNESQTIGIVIYSEYGFIVEANDYFLNMIGLTQHDIHSTKINWQSITPNKWHEKDDLANTELYNYDRFTPYEKELFHKNGKIVPILVGASLVKGNNKYRIAYVMDLSIQKVAQEQLRLASTVFQESLDGIAIADMELNTISVNHVLCDITGYDVKELENNNQSFIRSDFISVGVKFQIFNDLKNNGYWQGDIAYRKKDGALISLHMSISRVLDDEDNLTHHVMIISDITERKTREKKLQHLAHHDNLTGLPNRVLFMDRIEQALYYAKRTQRKIAIIYIDLDKFKPINDTYGHEAGDVVLKKVASRLKKHMRKSDTVTRLGGDEFVVLLKNINDSSNVEMFSNKLKQIVEQPIYFDKHMINIGMSSGFAIYPDNGEDVKSLLEFADNAMYKEKTEGKR